MLSRRAGGSLSQNDLRHAFRGLVQRPGFTAAALLTLGLGIGGNTAVFSIVNALLLRPLPLGEKGERVVTLHSTHPTQAQDFDWDNSEVSFADLEDFARESRALEETAGWVPRNFTLGGEPEVDAARARGGSITPNLFSMLGVSPRLGRPFRPEDAAPPGFESVVILSDGLWRRFGADPAIVGKAVRVNGRSLTVVGVMPERFKFPVRDELWVPYRPATTPHRRDDRFVFAFGTLKPGVTVAQAQEELGTIAARLAEQHPDTNRGWGVRVFAFRDQAVDRSARLLATTLLAAVGLVLLIACANLASLLLARGAARQREMAVRTALGARRSDLVRHLLAESLLLSVVGGALGLGFGRWGLDAVVASFPEELPHWIRLDLDGRVLAFAVLVSLLTALACGLAPALRASQPDVVVDLKEGGRSGDSPRHGRLQRALVVGQIAVCLALLMGASLLIRSFLSLQEAKGGFPEDGLLTLRVYLAGDAYDPIEAKTAFFRRVAERLRSLPGVRAAAATTSIPTDDGGESARAVADGRPVAPGEETGVSVIGVTPGLFETLATPPLEGRDFTEDENAPAGAQVAIVNRGLARRFWPDGGAIGSRIGLVEGGATAWLTVVGIAPEVQYEEFGEESAQSRLNVYVPYGRLGYRTMALLVRTEGPPAAAAMAVRQALRSLDAGLPAFDVRTMSEVRAYTTWEQRFFGQAMGVFAAAALLLACLGVYGLLAHNVSQRAHEMGIRLALGARPEDVVRQIVSEGLRLAGLGVVLGLFLALAVSRMLAGALYGVAATDPWTFLGLAAALVAVVLAASYIPARRAGRTDPMAALRCE